MAAQVGDSAPGFSLKNSNMEDVSLGDFSGKNVVLLFVPLAFTGICTQEFCDISAGINAYDELGAQVLGISVDTPFSLKAWAEKEGISIPLLSDFNKEVSAAYGAQFADLRASPSVRLLSLMARARSAMPRLRMIQPSYRISRQ